MNSESTYTLPSGLASCTWDIRTDEIEWRIPGDARRRNEALKEALKQLCLLQEERDQLAALVERLRSYIYRGSPINLNPEKCERDKLLAATPSQHLAEIKAQAGRAGFVAGLFSEVHCPTNVWNREERADAYANKIRSEATK